MIMQTQSPFNKIVTENKTSGFSRLTTIIITALLFAGTLYYLHKSNQIDENK